jgi:nonsense-mediated mRNA decay protein 3
MDFYFMDKQQALRFIDFLEGKVPIQTKYSRKLMTADHKSNIGKFKHNFIVTISTVCKVSLSLRGASSLSPLS